MEYLTHILSMQGLPPHGFCLLWQPELIWLHVVSDGVIGLSYYAIPVALAYFVWRRRDLAFSWMFWMFATFILACGTTHFAGIMTLWYPAYGLEGLVKAACALISVLTAILLWPLVIRVLAFPTPAEFRRVSNQLVIGEAERQQTLHRLRQSEESLRLLVNGVTDYALFMLAPGGRISSWNSGAERIKGYREHEILGRHFSVFYTPEDRDAGLPVQALETVDREGRYEGEGWRVRKDGSRFWASVVIDVLRDESGRPVGYAKVIRDITERRQAEQALEQSRAALAQAQKMETIGHLAGGIAHDFNNLLTAILGGASLLEPRLEEQADREGGEILAIIEDAAQRAAQLTLQLLAFSRKQPLRPEAIDANGLLTEMAGLLRRTLGEKIDIETAFAAGLWRTHVDANQLENVILNLAVNARDAMPEGGRLTLETGNVYLDDAYATSHPELKPGRYIMIAVNDTGTGMSEDIMRRAFDPFFTTKPEGRGTGLGLSQAFGFLKQSGGHITLDSEPGQGTTVKLYLPRHLQNGQNGTPAAIPQDSPAGIPRGSETVLVVEDHDTVRRYVVSTLRHLGYHVLEAADGKAALNLLGTTQDVALLFTDIGLPGINGRQLAEQARQCVPGLRVLYLTGYDRSAVSHLGLLDIGVNLLPKPFTAEVLAHRIRETLDTPSECGGYSKPAWRPEADDCVARKRSAI